MVADFSYTLWNCPPQAPVYSEMCGAWFETFVNRPRDVKIPRFEIIGTNSELGTGVLWCFGRESK